jgi:hypothetical protein
MIVIANYFCAELITLLVYLEKWDYQSTVHTQISIRYYIIRVWGLFVLYFINIFFNMYGGQIPLSFADMPFDITTFGCGTGYISNPAETSSLDLAPMNRAYYSNCVEDDIIINLLLVAFAEFFIYKLFTLIGFVFIWCCNSSKRNKKMYYKLPFNTEMEAANVFVLNIQLYVLTAFFPYVTALIFLMLLIEFKFEFFKLTVLKGKPKSFKMKYESGTVLMRLFLATIILITVIQVLFYVSTLPHLNQLLVSMVL